MNKNCANKETMSFAEMGLDASLLRRCESLGYDEPTPIQKKGIPIALSGADLIGCAETGTGKTAAFLLPIIQNLSRTPGAGVRALILAPTRELAAQIASNLHDFDPKRRLRSVTLVGGASMVRQLQGLRAHPAVVIATPGRLMDHLERGSLDLSCVSFLVLDEADRMLDLGFWPVISRIIAMLPKTRQTLLYSATMSSAIEEIARSAMRQPKLIEVSPRGRAPGLVKQTAYSVTAESKTALLLHLLEGEDESRVLVFTRTRRGAERLSHILAKREHQVGRIHADRTQPQREAALRGFKEGRHRVLVATDIAARGIDVEAISHVINYDVPEAPENYVHRIGRTGRAGNIGRASTLVTPVDEFSMRAIERLTGQKIERILLPNFGGSFAGNRAFSQESTRPVVPFGRAIGGGKRSFAPRRASR
jgi:ATP-dependent RNA helicase RhlE